MMLTPSFFRAATHPCAAEVSSSMYPGHGLEPSFV